MQTVRQMKETITPSTLFHCLSLLQFFQMKIPYWVLWMLTVAKYWRGDKGKEKNKKKRPKIGQLWLSSCHVLSYPRC